MSDEVTRQQTKPSPAPYTTSTSRASRDEQALHYHSIHHEFLERVARRHTKGDLHYGEYNWRKGLPWADVFNHAMTHLMHWKSEIEQGRVPDDDDLAAVAVNVEFLMYGEREAAFGCIDKVPPRPQVFLSDEPVLKCGGSRGAPFTCQLPADHSGLCKGK